MPSNTIQNIEDLIPSEVELLTQLLSLRSSTPSNSWLNDQSRLIASFPPSLLRPSFPLARLAIHLPFTPPCAVLCPTHKPLNPQLIRRIFLQITAECTMRVRRLQSYLSKKAKDEERISDIREFLLSIQGLNALWMSPKLFHDVYHVASRFERVESGCEACILARIGGDRRALVDLQSNVIGRKKKRRARPRIAPIVEGWIDWSGEGDKIHHASHDIGKKVRKIRKEMQRVRRERKETTKNSTQTGRLRTESTSLPAPAPMSIAKEIDDFDEDFVEGEIQDEAIISFYRDMVSSNNLLGDNMTATEDTSEIIHPAFCESVAFIPEQGIFQRRAHPTRQTFYSQSAYSRDSGLGGSSPMRDVNKELSHRQKAYHDLVGIPENWDDEEEREQDDEEMSSMTRWSELYKK